MSEAEQVDLLVLGSGEGGKFLAWHMAKSGCRTAVVERKLIGGSCPNTNCLPSKNEIWSAKVADLVHHADRFGMTTGPVSTDMRQVLARKQAMVDGLIAMHLDLYKSSGAELIMGTGQFVAPKTIEVSLNAGGARVLTATRIALNLGTHATVPNIPGLASAAPLTNVELLELDRLPAHLVVLGGGYVGLEFAQAYRRFGSRVTILEPQPRLAAREDVDIAAALLQMLRDEGIAVHLATKLLAVQGNSGSTVTLHLGTPTGEQTIEASDILVATGRSPNTHGIGLDIAGVERDERGFIRVNDRLETTAPDIWAIGDCAGSPQFTHVSFDDFRVVRDNLSGGQRSTRNRLVPYCMFTDPPLARIGLTEDEARRQNIAVRTASLPIVSVLRSRTIAETTGFMKALVEAQGDRILGFAMLGAEAGEVVAVVQAAMLAGLPYTGLRDAIITHPTMAEGLGALFSKIGAPQ
jgi:pyruvate/2-oxoglutarate dehydrogenase complex dihydrolipoamide dehydrogenase (E3) component